MRNKRWWGPLDIGCWGPQVQVQKGQRNQNVEQKLVGTLGHWVLGTPSGSAKRSAEQKCGTKISGDPFALVLRVPITQCPMVPTNFYSAIFVPLFLFRIFVPLTFLHLYLGSPLPMSNGPHQFLFCYFCSAFLFH